MKLTKKQIYIIQKMREGYLLMIGISDTTGLPYYLVTLGYDNIYFRSDTFSRLLNNGLIYQEQRNYEYILSELGRNIELKSKSDKQK